ncbi:cytochrome ubiquinol oxidase subunit I [Pseudofrankia sp. BMG5.37]|uniref:cytochrome ubiquinol oxidase subunit I n=1 Tax=Pseudofrankia sp. BMG5.37 TaxID=3050035 RepID=UPI00289619E1|nr:cytochrome ubiquinol oxidase subunit I [Pseudofrankia sp. BMG5.37]MDT3443521.1 cytochrome ubiquinol oxidase subunit I [Pseudofrankia sp. BMG5.37]
MVLGSPAITEAAARIAESQAAGSLALARGQTAFSLAFHICFAVFGVGIPWLLLYTEGRWLRTGDETWLALTKKWSRAFAVLFAVGAVSGTVLSFEFGLLWPAFMARYGGALGLSFTLEGFAFFAEAIFLGMYLYGWKRLSPRAHWLTLWPIAIAGTLSTLFIITANAWMNVPDGVVETADGRVIAAEPLAPLRSPSAPPQVAHMLLAALMCTGGVVAGIYAVGMLRGRRDTYHLRGLRVGLVVVLVCAPLQLVVGDWAGRVVGARQPVKLAAMEGLHDTRDHAPLTIGGLYDPKTGEVRYGIDIPDGLSLLEGFDPDHVVTGLDAVPADERPNATIVHLAFDTMVGLGTALIALSALVGGVALRRRRRGRRPLLPTGRPWLLAAVASGPASVLAMLAGWEVTEGGRQPWIVQGRMRVADAVTTTGGIGWIFGGTLALYLGLAAALVLILRRMATGGPGYEPRTPTEGPPTEPYPPDPDRPDPDCPEDSERPGDEDPAAEAPAVAAVAPAAPAAPAVQAGQAARNNGAGR